MWRLVSFFLLFVPVNFACAKDVVQPGDVLLISIAEAPNIGREAKVNPEGRISLPQLGGIEVAGADLDTIRQRIERALVDHKIVLRPTVVVEMSAYRPIYVGGAVAHPGAVAFEPGMTVRHILVLAGGPAASIGGTRPTTAELLELKAKWRTNAAALLQCESRIVRLKAELDHARAPNLGEIDRRFVPADEANSILEIDRQLLTDKLNSWTADQKHLTELLNLVNLELGLLDKQAEHQREEQELQRAEIENARKLLDKGLIPLPRLQELQRQGSVMSRDLLENRAFAARASQTAENTKYQIQSTETKMRMEVYRELAEALAEQIRLKAETEVLGASLLTAGISLGGDDPAISKPEPEVKIYRSTLGQHETLRAQMDTEVRPGDVVDVSVAEVPNG